MQIEPWCDPGVWSAAILTRKAGGDIAANRSLLALLQPSRGGVLWRTTKASVQHELGIPAQTSEVVRIDLVRHQSLFPACGVLGLGSLDTKWGSAGYSIAVAANRERSAGRFARIPAA